ncbi:MAG: leucine-rich repeat protein, partial [Rikenellaceae bacterium]
MKNLITYLFISVSAVCLFSCSEEVQEPTTTVGEPIEISINASAGAFTRAVYTEGDNDYAFSWSYGDYLRVYNSTSSWGSTFTTSSTSNSSSATFTGTIDSWSGTTDLYAIYDPLGLNESVETANAAVTVVYGNGYSIYASTNSTTNINNMGLLVGVIEDATTTNIPNATLNQAMSFLQITFEGDLPTNSSGDIGYIQLSTSTGDDLFVTSANIDITTGEITEVLSTTSVLEFGIPDINATNNVLTIALLPTTEKNAPIILTSSDYGDYEFSASEYSGFFERNTVYSGSINLDEFSELTRLSTTLDELNSITFDNTIQVSTISLSFDYSSVYPDLSTSEPLTYDDFAGLRTLLKNQNRKNVDLWFNGFYLDIPDNALKGIDTFDELYFWDSSFSKIGDSAFEDCTSIKYVKIYTSYYYNIGESAFKNCTNLQSVLGLEQCVSIEDSAFKDCVNLYGSSEDINYPQLSLNEITYIGDYAFYNCNNIDNIYLGEENSDTKLTYLGTGAFSDDNGSYTEDKKLYLYDSNAEYLTGDKTLNVSGQSYTFSTIYLNGTEYVHDSSSSSDDPAISVNNANKV